MSTQGWDADTAHALANRMAGYKPDPDYITRYVRSEYGYGPTRRQVEQMIAAHERRRKPRSNLCQSEHDKSERARIAAEKEARRVEQEDAALAARRAEAEAKSARAYAELQGEVLTPSRRIINAVAYAFTLPPQALVGRDRRRRHVLARQVAIKLLRDRMRDNGQHVYSLPQLGRIMGNRDHSTISHALQTFDASMKYNEDAAVIYDRLKGLVK